VQTRSGGSRGGKGGIYPPPKNKALDSFIYLFCIGVKASITKVISLEYCGGGYCRFSICGGKDLSLKILGGYPSRS